MSRRLSDVPGQSLTQTRVDLGTIAQRAIAPIVKAVGGNFKGFAQGSHRQFRLICFQDLVKGADVFSLFPANQAVAFANMSYSIWSWCSLHRNSKFRVGPLQRCGLAALASLTKMMTWLRCVRVVL